MSGQPFVKMVRGRSGKEWVAGHAIAYEKRQIMKTGRIPGVLAGTWQVRWICECGRKSGTWKLDTPQGRNVASFAGRGHAWRYGLAEARTEARAAREKAAVEAARLAEMGMTNRESKSGHGRSRPFGVDICYLCSRAGTCVCPLDCARCSGCRCTCECYVCSLPEETR